MRSLSRILLVAAFLASCCTAQADCRATALRILKRDSPDGFAIYSASQRDFFESWIDCGAAQFDLSTAVHESTHYVTGETDAFPLVGGGTIARPHEVSSFMPPYRIAERFPPDSLTTIYLERGKASSATDFLYLLDEFNAYSHDLATAVDLQALRAPDETVDHRDGLAAMMAFVAVYAQTARETDAPTWRGLREPQVAATIEVLWTRAERVMASSCGISNFGENDRAYVERVCAAGPNSALSVILKRPPACAAACLVANPEATVGNEAAAPAPTIPASPAMPSAGARQAGSLPRHPFALGRHHRLAG